MKKQVFVSVFSFFLMACAAYSTHAQMMGGFSNSTADWSNIVEHTTSEEKEGKEVWEKLQAKEITCSAIDDGQFEALGEYFMGAMMGASHPSMNAMIMQVHGKEGEEQIHLVMGKRLSGCDPSAVSSLGNGGWMPMMNMMTGGWSSPFGGYGGYQGTNNMMNFGFGYGFFGWILMVLWWVFVIVGIVTCVKWLAGRKGGK